MNDLVRLKREYKSIKDGMAKREDYFKMKPSGAVEVQDPFAGKDNKSKRREGENIETESLKENADAPDK